MKSDSEQLAAEIFQQITCNDEWHSNSQSSDCPDCGMERPIALPTQPPAEALGADEVARRLASELYYLDPYPKGEEAHVAQIAPMLSIALREAEQRGEGKERQSWLTKVEAAQSNHSRSDYWQQKAAYGITAPDVEGAVRNALARLGEPERGK